MKRFLLVAASATLLFALPSVLQAQEIIFTSDTVINSFDTNYDGAAIIVSNCTLTVNGPHTFSNLLVTAGGVLTHTFSSNGTVTVARSFIDESQVLNGTNAATLLHTGSLVAFDVTDVGKTVTYTNDLDYTFTTLGNDIVLQRTTNSTIPDGGTVLVSYTVHVSTPAGLNLIVNRDVEIAAGSAIDVSSKGFGGNLGTGPGGESFIAPTSGGGAGHGGYGGMSSSNAPGGPAYGSFFAPITLGSGGGFGSGGSGAVGGPGGGAIKIAVGTNFILAGSITANGGNGTNSRSGGGSGGSVWLSAQTISGAGSIAVNGGAGEPVHGGGGGGGRVAITVSSNAFTGTMTAFGGAGAMIGGAGTIYTKVGTQTGKLLVDNGGQTGATTNTLLQVVNLTDVTVRGRAVAGASGNQSFGTLLVGSNGVIVAVGPNTSVTLNTTGDLTIEPGGRISADGMNSFTGLGAGSSFSGGFGAYYSGGGGHGGYGGTGGHVNARGGNAFGSTSSPTSVGGPGGGSGTTIPPFGGMGGGALRIIVGGKLILNGSITSEGKSGSGAYAGGGAGGSVWLTLTSLSGSGNVSVNGAPGIAGGGGGGGGGRIAVTFNTNSFSGLFTAYGGVGTNTGGAGTIYVKTNSQTVAQVTLDNAGNAGTNTIFDFSPPIDLTILGRANPQLLFGSLSVRNLRVGSNCTLMPNPGAGQSYSVFVSGSATIDAGAVITVDGVGFGPAQGPGAGYYQSTQSPRGGGSHGGVGGNNPSGFGTSYGIISSPATAGSGGGNGSGSGGAPPFGGAGGGILNLTVVSTLTLNGRISANARDGDGNSGGGSGGSLAISCGPLLGSGTISANGGAGNGLAGGGGGGRIGITYTTNGFTGNLSAFGGNGLVAGGAGTIYARQQNMTAGALIVNNGGQIGTNTLLGSSLGLPTSAFTLTITGGAGVMPLNPLPVLSNLTIGANSMLTLPVDLPTLFLTVNKDITIAAGGRITVDGKGFTRTNGPGGGLSISSKGSGGGYGGIGGASSSGAPGGTNYGSSTQPFDRGSGGGAGSGATVGGSEGGGVARLTVGGTLDVNGSLSANGNPGFQDDSGGGSGGSLWVVAYAVSGSGLISANGGSGDLFGGGGGAGGRIAVYAKSNSFAGSVSASGGGGATVGGDGSVLWSSSLPSVKGTITDTNGQPVSGVLLQASLGNASAFSGLDGTYEIGVVPTANFTVTPSFSGFLFVPGSRSYSAGLVQSTGQDYLMISSMTPTMTSQLQNTNLVLNWTGIPGVTYQLFYSTNLVDWLPYGSSIVGTNGLMEVLIPTNNDPAQFFRVLANN